MAEPQNALRERILFFSNGLPARNRQSKPLIAIQECTAPNLTLGDAPIDSFVGDWFALHGWTGREKELARKLTEREIAYFLPLETRRKISGDKRYETRDAIFPGYTFVCADPEDKHLALFEAADVARSLGQTPRIVPWKANAAELATLHIVCASGQPIVGMSRRKTTGAHVEVVRGPLMGAKGYIIHVKDRCRLQVQVTSMDSSPELEVDEDDVEVID